MDTDEDGYCLYCGSKLIDGEIALQKRRKRLKKKPHNNFTDIMLTKPHY
jgi:hypothetical protein